MKTDKKPYDTAFKDLAAQDPEALLRLVGAIPPGATVRLLPREVSAPTLAADQPYEVISGDERFIAHVEAQTRWELELPARIVEYDALLWINYHLPVRSFILVLTRQAMPADAPTFFTIEADGLTLTARFTVVKLWELPADEALAMGSENLLPFVPLMKGGEQELEQSARALRRVADPRRRQELALHFVVLGGLRYNRENLFDLLGRLTMIPIQSLRESSVYQFILAEGREEGLEEGREEGRKEALSKVLHHLIAKRFPGFSITDELERANNLDALEQICFDFDEIADTAALRARLAELTAQQ